MKRFIVIFILSLVGAPWAHAEKDIYGTVVSMISPKTSPLAQLNSELDSYSRLTMYVGQLYGISDAVTFIGSSAQNEITGASGNTAWTHVFRIRMLSAFNAVESLKKTLPEKTDESIRVLINSTIATLQAVAGRISTGDTSYWTSQINYLATQCYETSKTLRTAGDLLLKTAETHREAALGILKTLIEKPESLPEALKDSYEQQLTALKTIETTYEEKKKTLEADYKKLRETFAQEATLRQQKLDRDLIDATTNGQKEAAQAHENEVAALAQKQSEIEVINQKTNQATEERIAALKAEQAKIEKNIETVRAETQTFINSASTVQQNLDNTLVSIQNLVNQIKMPPGGSILVEHNSNRAFGDLLHTVLARAMKYARSYSDPQLWDRLQPSFKGSLVIENGLPAENKTTHEFAVNIGLEMRIGFQVFQLSKERLLLKYFGRSMDDKTPIDEVQSLGAAWAPQIARALQDPEALEWVKAAAQAHSACETHLQTLSKSIPANTIKNATAYPR